MNNIWHNIDEKRIQPENFIAVIEIAKGSKKKYELDKETGLIILDRVLYTSTQYPANYGFLPKTLSDDGDPLDVLVLCSESLDPLTLVKCFPIGVITMIDNGKTDEKVIALPFGDPVYNAYKNLEELPKHIRDELLHFLTVYKNLEDKICEVKEIEGKEKAIESIKKAKEKYNEIFCQK